MFASVWPLAVLLITDAIGICWVASLILANQVVEGAYLAWGLVILQIPFCLRGVIASCKARLFWLTLVYIGHAAFSIVLGIFASQRHDLARFL